MVEEWQSVPDYEGIYEVSNMGNVRSLDREINSRLYGGCVYRAKGKPLKPKVRLSYKTRFPYRSVNLKHEGTAKQSNISRLVLMAFDSLPPTNQHHAMHKNSNTMDDRLDNLQWATSQEISDNMIKHGTQHHGEMCYNHTLTDEDIRKICELRGKMKQKDIGKIYGMSQANISLIQLRGAWKHVSTD